MKVRDIAEFVATSLARSAVGRGFVRWTGTAPIAFKTPMVMRIANVLVTRSGREPGLAETNLGIPGNLRLSIPAVSASLAFGRPDHYLSERATYALAMTLAPHSTAFIDVGANEGLFTYGASVTLGRARHADIHLFEPDEEVFARLSGNLARNNIGAVANQMAVSDKVGTQTFHRNLDDNLSGSLSDYFTPTHRTVAVEMKVTTLSAYLEARAITDAFVKVDVEGAGPEVWAGARAGAARIKWMIYEMLAPEIEARLPLSIIRDGAFFAYYIRDFDLVPSPDGEYDYKAPFFNWMFCRLDPAALASFLAGSRFRVVGADGAAGKDGATA